MFQSYVFRHTFENSIGYDKCMVQDGVTLPSITTMDNGACIELLRGAQSSERTIAEETGRSSGSYRQGLLILQVR